MPTFYEWLASAMTWITGGCFVYVPVDSAALIFKSDGSIEAALPKDEDVEFDSPMWRASAVMLAQDNPVWQQMSRAAYETFEEESD